MFQTAFRIFIYFAKYSVRLIYGLNKKTQHWHPRNDQEEAHRDSYGLYTNYYTLNNQNFVPVIMNVNL